jgi:putative ABC transport system permease protein
VLTYIKIAFRNVLVNKRRSLFTIISVAIGTIIMILTFSLSNGVRENMVKNSLAMFTGHINIYGTQTIRGRELNLMADFDEVDSLIKEEIGDELGSVMYRTSFYGDVYDPLKQIKSKDAHMIGMNIDDEHRLKETAIVLSGDLESIKEKGYAILDEATANRYTLKIGDEFQFKGLANTEEYGVVFNTVDLTLGAIIKTIDPTSQISTIRVSNETGRFFSMDKNLEYSTINIYLKDRDKANDIETKLGELLKEKEYDVTLPTAEEISRASGGRKHYGRWGWRGKDEEEIKNSLKLTTWSDETAYLEKMIKNLDRISTFLNIVLLSLILVGISNTLIVSVRERTNEIGTVRAIGMKQGFVMFMFIIEGIILGLFGILIGALIGVTLAGIFSTIGIYIGPSTLSMYLLKDTLYLKLSIETILIVSAVVIGVSAVASIYPSFSASRLSPTVAMDKE